MKLKNRILAALTLAGAVQLGAQTVPLYINNNYIDGVPPQIDATAFLNTGFMDFFLPSSGRPFLEQAQPFETFNTVNYTNRGIMLSTLGFRFRHATPSGNSKAGNFINVGSVVGEDSSQQATINGFTVAGRGYAKSWLFIEATNVQSSGVLGSGEGGLLKIEGKNLDLSRGGIRASFSQTRNLTTNLYEDRIFGTNTFYANPPGIYDNYWGVGTNGVYLGSSFATLPVGDNFQSGFFPPLFVYSQPHQVRTNINDFVNYGNLIPSVIFQGGLITDRYNYTPFVYTNSLGGTNSLIQVVFVATNINNGEVTARARFAFGRVPDDVERLVPFPVLEVRMRVLDVSLGDFITNYLYLSDRSAALSNRFFSTNVFSSFDPLNAGLRPNSYRVSRAQNQYWSNSIAPNSTFNYNSHIYSFTETAREVTNGYSAYSFFFNRERQDSLTNLFGAIDPDRDDTIINPYLPFALYDATNQSGRVNISADNRINLKRTRVLAERYLDLKSPHVEYDTNTILNAPFMSFEVGSTNGLLELNNLLPETVKRNQGYVRMHTTSWTNTSVTFTVNGSNVVDIERYVWIVDLENLFATNNVVIYNGSFTADNLVVDDVLRVTRNFVMDAYNVTINTNGQVLPRLEVLNLNDGNFPRLVNFTNRGLISITGLFALGQSPFAPIASWRNEKDIIASANQIRATSFYNSKLLSSYLGASIIEADTITITNGEVKSSGDTVLKGKVLNTRGSVVRSGATVVQGRANLIQPGRLILDITNTVNDGGVGANNRWYTYDGFELRQKPVTGDLRGTLIDSYAPNYREVFHRWAGEDRGMSAAGYSNNMAVGRLRLNGTPFSLFTFEPMGTQNAIYVEYLELAGTALLSPAGSIDIKPGMTVYFADSNVAPSLLDGLSDNRLRHLPLAAAAASTLITLRNGQQFLVKNWLLTSDSIDSDMDGIMNLYDDSPFDDVKITVKQVTEPAPAAVVSWQGAPGTEYTLQYRADLNSNEWTDVMNKVVGIYPLNLKFSDPVNGGNNRYYRVVYRPF